MTVIKLGNGLLNAIYPVGSIYLSVVATNPSQLFGGTWEQIKDRFLLACGDIYSNGATGGEAEHILSINETPYHEHISKNYSKNWNAGIDIPSGKSYASSYIDSTGSWNFNGTSGVISGGEINEMANTSGIGGNQPHNNMPPYFTVYMWKRTA